jgi:hypothetical protein
MGVRSFVRDRKQVQADRAETGSHQKLVAALSKTNNKSYSASHERDIDQALYIANGPSNGGVYDQAMEGR